MFSSQERAATHTDSHYNDQMNTTLLPCIELETGPTPRASVIWLHGLGADGHDFEPIVQALRLPSTPAIRFVFPHAPQRPVTINGGLRMRAWYDIFQMGGGPEDADGIHASQAQLNALITRETQRGVAPSHIVLAGFSQGGAIVLQTGLRHAERLGGILALSTYLPLASTVAQEAAPANRSLPIFMAHGQYDPVIALPRAEHSRDALQALGYAIDWHVYDMEHAVCPEELGDLRAWLMNIVNR